MLINKEDNGEVIWGIWKMEESTDFLLGNLSRTDPYLQTSSPKRLKEQLSARVLLKNLLEEEKSIAYLPNGKPYLVDNSWNISISHTRGYVAVILSKSKHTGIDIEYISEKVKRVKDRFISDLEYITPEDETIHLLLHWSAKETIYKALGCEGIDLKNDFIITKFIPSISGNFDATEFFTKQSFIFNIKYWINQEFVITLTY